MGHLAGIQTQQELTSIEIVSDDAQQVLRIQPLDNGVRIAIRDAADNHWSYKEFARLDPADAKIIAAAFEGGRIDHVYGIEDTLKGVPTSMHTIPKPEPAPGEPVTTDSDCTALDIERAKAANIAEAKQLVQLEMERDHALDRHVGAEVPGCPACERRIRPGYGDGSLTNVEARGQTMPADGDPEDLPF